MIQALRGMKDILEVESEKYRYFIQNCEIIAKNYGFEYIETPPLEETALFKRSVGESSDIVNKEMYQFFDKGGNDVCLRPEGTAGVVRSFIQNKFDKASVTKRFFYHGPMFRYERPQKGRLRCFHQFGVESFGISDVKEDAAVILLLQEILDFFGIKTELKLNSLGCPNCMPQYKQKLILFLQSISYELCEDCQKRINTNPIRVLDCKNTHCQSLLQDAPKITQNLCDECDSDFLQLKNLLESTKVSYRVDPSLVRGLDYYNKTAFEFISGDIGAQSAVAGGGRYDKLVEYLDGKSTYGVGFAIGVERLLELVTLRAKKREGYLFASSMQDGINWFFSRAKNMRRNQKITLEYTPKNLKAALKLADKNNALFLAYIGEDELKNKTVWLKNLEEKEENIIAFDDF